VFEFLQLLPIQLGPICPLEDAIRIVNTQLNKNHVHYAGPTATGTPLLAPPVHD